MQGNACINKMNVIHSIDGMVVREMQRRCNHDKDNLNRVLEILNDVLFVEDYNNIEPINEGNFISLRLVDKILSGEKDHYNINDLLLLRKLIKETLSRKSFPIITVHDEFKSAPNNMNVVRQTYIDILAELADSNVLQDIIQQITQTDGVYSKSINNLSDYIRNSEYALS